MAAQSASPPSCPSDRPEGLADIVALAELGLGADRAGILLPGEPEAPLPEGLADAARAGEEILVEGGWAVLAIRDAQGAELGLLWLAGLAAPFAEPQRRMLRLLAGQAARLISHAPITASLRRSEEMLSRVQRIGRVGGFEIDLTTGINARSPEYMTLQGRAMQPAIEAHADWVARLHPEDRDRAERHFLDSVADGRPVTDYAQDYRIVTPGGEVRWIHAKAEIERDAEGRALRMIGAHIDVTALRQVETALRRLNETLEEQVEARTRALHKAEAALRQAQKLEAIGQLTGGIAHDFNNLLQVLTGNLQMLEAGPRSPEEARRLQLALGAVERGAKLSQQLLAFARQQPLAPRAIDLGALVTEMEDLLRRVLGETIAIETHAAPDLWPTQVDPQQVENAILNLAVNARDAMPSGGRLTIAAANAPPDPDRPGDHVALTVEDTGMGIPAEILDRVFEPFFTTKPTGEGTGLGLSMVYGFVQQSGGDIRIDSVPGQGTRIRLLLPRSEAPVEPRQVLEPGIVQGEGETVLVVEDSADVRQTVSEMLAQLGYRVLGAPDAAAALAMVRQGARIDLLLTDVVMPGELRAPELARQVQEISPDTAVLFTSGYAEKAIVHNGRLDEGIELLSKPYRREDLARRVRQTLRSHRERAGRSWQILLVEDDPIILLDTAMMLRGLGHAVETASSTRAAMEVLAAGRVDLLMTDIGLGRESGLELARAAQAARPGLRIVYMSGYGAPEGAIMVQKPFHQAALVAALRQAGAVAGG